MGQQFGRLRIDTQPGLTITIAPSLSKGANLLMLAFAACLLCSMFLWMGITGVVSGDGVGGDGRGMTPSSPEALLVSWVFLLTGSIAIPAILYWALWNCLVRERFHLDGDFLVLSRRALAHGVTVRLARQSLTGLRTLLVPSGRGTAQILGVTVVANLPTALSFWDFSTTVGGATVVCFECDGKTYHVGLSLNADEARELVRLLEANG